MSISEWIENREMTGFPTFSYQEVRETFPSLATKTVPNELRGLCRNKRIQSVHKGFYTAVPIQFKDRGIVPPCNYIGQLMAYLEKPYYISLLSAGVLHVAAHQRPQRLSIMTVLPRVSFPKDSNKHLFCGYRKEIPKSLLCETNSDTGTILYSNAELTAIDLIQFSHLVGGLSAATTVIEELTEKTDFEQYGDNLMNVTTLSTIQRLGYILDEVLDNQAQADALYGLMHPYVRELKYRPLTTERPTENAEKNSKWKIFVNQEIEPDEW